MIPQQSVWLKCKQNLVLWFWSESIFYHFKNNFAAYYISKLKFSQIIQNLDEWKLFNRSSFIIRGFQLYERSTVATYKTVFSKTFFWKHFNKTIITISSLKNSDYLRFSVRQYPVSKVRTNFTTNSLFVRFRSKKKTKLTFRYLNIEQFINIFKQL